VMPLKSIWARPQQTAISTERNTASQLVLNICAVSFQLNFLAQTLRLYLWGLTEVVNADRRRAKPRHFGKIAYVDGTASYEEVAAVYKKIGYPLPDRSIFDLSTKLLERFDQLAAKNRPSKQ